MADQETDLQEQRSRITLNRVMVRTMFVEAGLPIRKGAKRRRDLMTSTTASIAIGDLPTKFSRG